MTLPGGWTVDRPLARAANATGSVFSTPYVVRDKNGHEAFLKAMDLSQSFGRPDMLAHMERTLRCFRYERDLVKKCADRKMDRIVRVLDSGEVLVDPTNQFSVVFFLVFEMAEGDVHSFLDLSAGIDTRWTIRTLFEVSIGLTQLHARQIAHQDIKPSNVIVFRDTGSKIGDLGKASSQGAAIDHDDDQWAGDGKYTPPELMYGFGSADWMTRRFGCDAYMFGALAVFLVTGLCVTPEIQDRLPPELCIGTFSGPYVDLLPFLRQATNELLLEVEMQVAEEIRPGIMGMARELLEPDPTLRGHRALRQIRHGNRYDLRRYTTELDVMLRKAEHAAISARKAL